MSDADGETRKAQILGLGVYRPHRSVPNAELIDSIESSDEWIRERTGIQSRRWADDGEELEVMAFEAGRAALAAAGLDASSVDMVMVATCSSVQPYWPTASRVAGLLGLESPAFDLNATCA